MRYITYISLIALTCCIVACKGYVKNTDTPPDNETIIEEPDSIITLAFVGDVMMGTTYPKGNYITEDRGASLFENCKHILRSADLAIANLEGNCYSGEEGKPRWEGLDNGICYMFRMPGDHAKHLADAGIDVVNMANNHSFDFLHEGRIRTLATMDSVGIKVTGIRKLAEGCVLMAKGYRVGYVSFAASCTDVLCLRDEAEVDSMVAHYRELCDVLIVGFHGGAEGANATHVGEGEEIFLGERRGDVKKFAHRCIDLGADMVIGHGPHVPRAMELYKEGLIAYSLGNFCAPYRISIWGSCGHAPLLEVTYNAVRKKFCEAKIHSFILKHGKGPQVDSLHLAARDIQRLTKQDFPHTPLCISDEGRVTRK